MTLYLVRHGRPLVDRTRPAHEWELDPAHAADVSAMRPHLPEDATWFSSPEPKARATAALLTDRPVTAVDDLREHERHSHDWIEDFGPVVARAFDHPDAAAYPGWEPLLACRRRVTAAVRELDAFDRNDDLVLVGHGTAWILLVAELTEQPPGLGLWRAMRLPDLVVLGQDPTTGRPTVLPWRR